MINSSDKVKLLEVNKKYYITALILFLLSFLITLVELIIIDPTMSNLSENLIAALALFALTLMLNITLYIYLIKVYGEDKHIARTLGVVFTALTITVLLSFLIKEYVHAYAMPIAFCGLILVLLQDKRIAIFSTVITAQIVFVTFSITSLYFNTVNIIDAISVVTAMASGLFIVYFIDQNYTRMRLISIAFITGIIMGAFAAVATAITTSSVKDILFSTLWTIVGNLLSVVLAMALLPIIEKIFGLFSNFSLMEYCSFENPVLKRLKVEAPGTFNHSLVVGNLAEHCALAINKNPVLARAAAYYHDVGKLKDPEYFIENQVEGYNPHDDLIPELSVKKITMHTDEGAKILRENKFPKLLIDVAQEHHGDSPLQFFYVKAQNITEDVLGSEEYRYKGPKPTSVTSAIVMIADMVEAASRTKGFMDAKEIAELVDSLIKEKINLGQFDDCNITMNDLNNIKNTIVNVMPGIYHGRLSYPEINNND